MEQFLDQNSNQNIQNSNNQFIDIRAQQEMGGNSQMLDMHNLNPN